MANENKQAVVNAIWANPQPAFGCSFRQSSRYWENLKNDEYDERGKIRLALTNGGTNIRVFYNGSSREENTDVFTYLQQYRLSTSTFGETIKALADAYNLNLEFSTDERRKMARAELARALAPSFVEALKRNPNGETARYLKETRRLEPDAHFGELTADTLKQALQHLNNRGIAYDAADVAALGLTEERAKAGYNCVIPYTVNGRVVGFLTRNIRKQHNGPKYLYSEGIGRVGYCDTLTNGKPAYVVEGPMDAIRLIQQGVENVVAIGGAKIGEEIGRLLRSHNIVEVFYIPDHETDVNQQRETKLVADAIQAFQSVRVDNTPVVERLYIVDLPTPDDWTQYPKYGKDGTLKGYKIDADTYGAEHPDELRGAVEMGGVVSWEWELAQLMAWAVAQDNATGSVGYNEFQRRFNDIYTRCQSPYERQRIRQFIATGRNADIYRAFGITPQSCEDADAWKRADEYNERVRTAAADLNRAVEEQADAETVAAIVRRLNDAQGANTRDEWAAQLSESFDDELEAIRNQPETLRTRWEVGNIDKTGQYHKYERIEFYPADIEVFCAPTTHGKTMILFQAAFDLIRDTGKTFLYVSCEENKRQLVERALNVFIDIPTTATGKDGNGQPCFIKQTRKRTIKAIIRGSVPPEEYDPENMYSRADYDKLAERVRAEVKQYGSEVRPRLKFVHTEASAESICNNVLRFVEDYRNNGVDVGGVFVDYMQLLTAENANYSRHDELKDICKALKDCAARIELPVILAAQLNREVLKTGGIDNITEANIGEGADIERIAHDIYFVWQVDRTRLEQFSKGNATDGQPRFDPSKLNVRSRRLFTRGELGRETETTELKRGYLYVEQMKARDGLAGGWGLFPYDGERGRIGSIDTDKMKQ